MMGSGQYIVIPSYSKHLAFKNRCSSVYFIGKGKVSLGEMAFLLICTIISSSILILYLFEL